MAAAVGTDAFCWWISVLMIPRMISHLTAQPHAAQKKGTFIHIRYSLTLLRPRGRTYNKRENLPGRLEKAYIGTYCRVLARLPWTIFSQHGQRNENFMSKKWKKLVIISPVYDWCWGSQALSTLVGLLTEICFSGGVCLIFSDSAFSEKNYAEFSIAGGILRCFSVDWHRTI